MEFNNQKHKGITEEKAKAIAENVWQIIEDSA